MRGFPWNVISLSGRYLFRTDEVRPQPARGSEGTSSVMRTRILLETDPISAGVGGELVAHR